MPACTLLQLKLGHRHSLPILGQMPSAWQSLCRLHSHNQSKILATCCLPCLSSGQSSRQQGEYWESGRRAHKWFAPQKTTHPCQICGIGPALNNRTCLSLIPCFLLIIISNCQENFQQPSFGNQVVAISRVQGRS